MPWVRTKRDVQAAIASSVWSGDWVPAWETVRKWMRTGSLAVTLPTSDAPVYSAFVHLEAATVPTKEHRMARARVPLGRGPEADAATECGAPPIPAEVVDASRVVGWGLGDQPPAVGVVGNVAVSDVSSPIEPQEPAGRTVIGDMTPSPGAQSSS